MRIEDCLAVIGRDAAWLWIVQAYRPAGPCCPSCGARIQSDKALDSFLNLKRTWCKGCGRAFTPTFGTPIHETSWQPEEFLQWQILHLAGRVPVEIARHLGKSPAAVRDMTAKVELMRTSRGVDTLVSVSPIA